MSLQRGEIKAFRDYLNAKYGVTFDKKGQNGRKGFGALKRAYGDYLYNQDREMFMVSLEECKKDGRFTFIRKEA